MFGWPVARSSFPHFYRWIFLSALLASCGQKHRAEGPNAPTTENQNAIPAITSAPVTTSAPTLTSDTASTTLPWYMRDDDTLSEEETKKKFQDLFASDSSTGIANRPVKSIDLAINQLNAAMIQQNQMAIAGAAGATPLPLRVATLNTGLQCKGGKILAIRACEKRSAMFGPYLQSFLTSPHAPDVMFLQEVWKKDVIQSAARAAAAAGYKFIAGPQPHGLRLGAGVFILIRCTILPAGAPVDSGFIKYPRDWWELTFGVNRGLLYARFPLPNGQTVLVGTLHMTPDIPTVDFYAREFQRRHLTKTLHELGRGVSYFVVGGDFNIAANFSEIGAFSVLGIQMGARTYMRFAQQNMDLRILDTFRVAHPNDPGYTHDHAENLLIRPSKSRERRRIDYIWVGSAQPGRNYFVTDSAVIFKDPILGSNQQPVLFEGQPLTISDHFGLASVVNLY